MSPARPADRRYLVPFLTLLLAGAMTSLAGPAGAHPAGPGPRTPARELASNVRAAMDTGSLAEVLSAAGMAVPQGSQPRSVDPVLQLSTAIQSASRLVRSALPAGISMAELEHEARRAMHRDAAPRDVLGPAGHEAFDRAAELVAAAIDSSIPQLLARPTGPSPRRAIAGCDIIDQAPALCVAGTGDNVITEDYALVIDRGGSDLHENSAGGAQPLSNGLPVSVTIDLDGNDRYAAALPSKTGAFVAQGAGYLGVGFLVDVAGNDSYSVLDNHTWARAYGQGFGQNGFGLLADLGGNDTYELSTTGGADQIAKGQGMGENGAGFLLDRQGDDHYTMDTRATDFWVDSQTGKAFPPGAFSSGQGMALMGSWGFELNDPPAVVAVTIRVSYGILADGAGSDTLEMHATMADPKQDELYRRLVWLPEARADGIGSGASGATGVALLGEGNTDAEVTADGHAPLALVTAKGFGYGYSGSEGILLDLGGDDTRHMTADVAIERRATHAQDCDCLPPGTSISTGTVLLGMGYGNLAGTGLLEDAAGDDRYLASATGLVEAELRDERADEHAAPMGSYARSGSVTALVQGAGEDEGAGELLDEGGDDVYEVTASNQAWSAASAHGNAPAPTATAIVQDASVVAQGSARTFGEGTFTDLGGSDVYEASAGTVAEAQPATDVQLGTPVAGVLGGVDLGSRASFLDRDEGRPDQFTASPAVPACSGTRGQGQWVDCGGAGVGAMA